MRKLNLIPRGNVNKNYDYGINKVEYESGVAQYQRKWLSPRITFSFNTQGDKEMKEYLEEFVMAHGGNYKPFLWEYEGKEYVVRFSEASIEFEEIRGYGGEGTVGYNADIGLIVQKKGEY